MGRPPHVAPDTKRALKQSLDLRNKIHESDRQLLAVLKQEGYLQDYVEILIKTKTEINALSEKIDVIANIWQRVRLSVSHVKVTARVMELYARLRSGQTCLIFKYGLNARSIRICQSLTSVQIPSCEVPAR